MIVYPQDNINKLDLIQDAITNHYGVQFKGFLNETPSWESFIKHIDKSFMKKKPYESDQYMHQIGEIFFWNYLSLQVDRADLYFNEYLKLNSLLKEIHPEHKTDSAFSIISFTKNEPSPIGNHYDDIDIFSWQCQGESIWYIGDDDENRQEFHMEPGDVVFCPAWNTHEVIPLSPRAAISAYVISGRSNHREHIEIKRYR
jgi:ribosomal protein L16 Arg81 hydroxylase